MAVVVRDGDGGRLLDDGRAIDLRAEPYTPETVSRAIRGESTALAVDCPSPSRRWE